MSLSSPQIPALPELTVLDAVGVEDWASRILIEGANVDRIDAAVHVLIEAVHTRGLDEGVARRGVLILVKASGAGRRAVSAFNNLTAAAREEIIQGTDEIVEKRILDNTTGRGFDLNRGATASACGWAYSMAQAAAPSELRRWRNNRRRNGESVDPTAYEFGNATPRWAGGPHQSESRIEVETALDLHDIKARGAREGNLRAQTCDSLVRTFGLSHAIRPLHLADREEMRAALEADTALAARSARLQYGLVIGKADLDPQIDLRLLALWDDYTIEQLEELLALGPAAAHALAVGACSPLPRPAAALLSKIRTRVRGHLRTRNPQWKMLTAALVDSWVAANFDAVSEYAPPSLKTKRARSHHLIARERLDEIVRHMVAFQGQPMGITPDCVLERLRDITAEVLAEEADERHEEARERLRKRYESVDTPAA